MRGQSRGYAAATGWQPGSTTETYVAVRMAIESWRWADVPFYIRAGKSMPVTATEVMVSFRRPPQRLFDERCRAHQPPALPPRPRPRVIALGARTKVPGDEMVGGTWNCRLPPSSRRDDAVRAADRRRDEGRRELFARQDSIEEAWRDRRPNCW